jgi:glucoamylase
VALLAAAELAERVSQAGTDSLDSHTATMVSHYLRETADVWYSNLDHWIYARNTDLSRKLGVEGYYVRIAPPDTADGSSPMDGFVPIKNRPPAPPADSGDTAVNIVSPDALALVRFGLRPADDPRIANTVWAIDALVRVDLPQGLGWRRYNHDGYGEHEDGRPFDGTGVGRAWPLLTGERAHFELAAGRREEAYRLLNSFRGFANHGGLLPEQTWDADDIPDRELFRGGPSGSAMPLVWAHAEYVKLLRSLRDGKVFDMPPQAVRRYQHEQVISPHHIWRFNHKCRSLPAGKDLRIETLLYARIRWTTDGWHTVHDTDTEDSLLGVHFTDLSVSALSPGSRIDLTFFWPQAGRWEGTDFTVIVSA